MVSSSAVRDQLTDILVRVVGCPADAVLPEAGLKELGTDSLTIVEMAEELGRRFDVYLSDDTIDAMITVQDAIDAVVHHDGSQSPSDAARVPTALESPAPPPRDDVEERHHLRRGLAARMAFAFIILGVALGAVLGLGGSALINATGIDAVDLPPINAPSSEPTSASPTTPSPEPTETEPEDPKEPEPTIESSDDQVAPGQRFTLSGAFPAAGEGADLQVQVKDEGSAWDDFPIDTTTKGGGEFKTELYTSRPGKRQFRLLNKKTDKPTPAVTVQIG